MYLKSIHREVLKCSVAAMALLLCGSWLTMSRADETGTSLEIATFSADITPPVGKPVGLEFIPDAETVEHPLMAKGLVLQDSGGTFALCAVDWMEVHNESHDLLRAAIATAAKIPISQVALHCVHQHTAPAISSAALQLQFGADHPRRVATLRYLDDVADKLTKAVQGCQNHWQQITHIGTSKANVEQVASNRRIELPDGTIRSRASNTKDAPELREYPEGLIDPWLRTVSFYRSGKPTVQLHYFATHPQSFYRDGRISYDIPGIVRERLQEECGVFQVYFTGCGGDVAMGKYNSGTREDRSQLSQRVYDAMKRSVAHVTVYPAHPVHWQVAAIHFPPRQDAEFTEEPNRGILADTAADSRDRLKAAIALAWIQRVRGGHPVELSCLRIGPVQILHLPGEPFVQYQLAAQRMQPDRFICVAGYGDCGMGYIGGDRIYTDRGGYEQTYAFSGPCEQLLLDTIERLVTGETR